MHVVLLAHGSRDPRHGEVMDAIAEAARAALKQTAVGVALRAVSVAYLDHAAPSLAEALTPATVGPVVVVPLLLTDAFHARVDVPAAVDAARTSAPNARLLLTPGVGDPLLTAALSRRVAETGVDPSEPGTAAVVMAAGTSDPAARTQVAEVAASWSAGAAGTTHAFVAGEGPTVADAVAQVAAGGAQRVVLAPYVLAPGVLPDRGTEAARTAAEAAGIDLVVAAPIGAAPELVAVVVERITAAPS